MLTGLAAGSTPPTAPPDPGPAGHCPGNAVPSGHALRGRAPPRMDRRSRPSRRRAGRRPWPRPACGRGAPQRASTTPV